jgi:hypothetical protein
MISAMLLKQRGSKCSSLLWHKKFVYINFVCTVRLLMQLTVIFCHLFIKQELASLILYVL